MQLDKISEAIFDLLNVASVTNLLSTWGSDPALFIQSAPPKAKLPYIVFLHPAGSPFDTHSRRGEDQLYQVSVFARKQYDAENIMSKADEVLHLQNPSPSGMSGLKVRREEGNRLLWIPEEEVYHASCDYRITAQE